MFTGLQHSTGDPNSRYSKCGTCMDPEGGQGVQTPPTPLKNHKNIGYLGTTGPDSMENYKATKPAFHVGHHGHASQTPFKWRFAGGPMMARF